MSKNLTINKIKNLHLDIDIQASDKSVSHRSIIFSLFANGKCKIKNFLTANDTLHTTYIAKQLGLNVAVTKNHETIITPSDCIKEPTSILPCGNSGTSMRLFCGLLSGANVYSILFGDKYLHKRPMGRILKPLIDNGANILSRKVIKDDKEQMLAPLTIIPTKEKLKPFNYFSYISSAQVKSAMILSAMFGKDVSTFEEIFLSRDHSENMILAFQNEKILEIQEKDSQNAKDANASTSQKIIIQPFENFNCLNAFDITIANDPSSAFFLAVLASILPNCQIRLRNVFLNKTRIEAYKVLQKMGANITYENIKDNYEIVGDIIVKSASLKGIDISKNISWMIDELPALSVAMSVASGKSSVRNAGELRVKESDRISVLVKNLKAFGIECEEVPDGFDIVGGEFKENAIADSYGDHRIAMSFIVASALNGGMVKDCECIKTSFPNFFNILSQIGAV